MSIKIHDELRILVGKTPVYVTDCESITKYVYVLIGNHFGKRDKNKAEILSIYISVSSPKGQSFSATRKKNNLETEFFIC